MFKQLITNLIQRWREHRKDLEFEAASTLDHIRESFELPEQVK